MRVNSFPRTVIEIVPPTGESFILAGGRNQRAFILPDTVDGFETPVEHTYRDSVTSYGDRSVGWKIPAVESSFEFYLRDIGDVADVYRRFRRAFRSGSRIVFVHRLACFIRVLRFRCLRMLTVNFRRGGLFRVRFPSVGLMAVGWARLSILPRKLLSWLMGMSL